MSAETLKPLLKNLGAKLRQMMAEDWRGENERNTLGMAGYWLEKLAEDPLPKCDQFGRDLLPDFEEAGEGIQAAQNGFRREDNPYLEKWHAWNSGYDEEQNRKQEPPATPAP